MTSDPARLLEAALELPEEARAALVALLLDSLDSNVDSDARSYVGCRDCQSRPRAGRRNGATGAMVNGPPNDLGAIAMGIERVWVHPDAIEEAHAARTMHVARVLRKLS